MAKRGGREEDEVPGQEQRLGWAGAFSLFSAWLKGTFVWHSETLRLGAGSFPPGTRGEEKFRLTTFFHCVLKRRGGPELGAVTLPSPATSPGPSRASPRRTVLRAAPCLALSWSGAAQPGPGTPISAAGIWSAASGGRAFPSSLFPGQTAAQGQPSPIAERPKSFQVPVWFFGS